MRISDWSSDVCSSDLDLRRLRPVLRTPVDIGTQEIGLAADISGEQRHRILVAAKLEHRLGLDAAAVVLEFQRQVRRAASVQRRHRAVGILVEQPDDGELEAGPRLLLARSEEHTSELQSLMRN